MSATTSRVMLPDDSNPAGNVHGGSTLKLIEETALIAASRHLARGENADADGQLIRAALARVEETSFLGPIYIGDIARVEANVSYCSKRSLEVTVDVFAERAHRGEQVQQVLTNHAVLWYVAVLIGKDNKVTGLTDVPPLENSEHADPDGQKRYEAQKALRAARDESLRARLESPRLPLSVPNAELSQVVLPSDCDSFGYLRGGVLMKLMDNASGIVAVKHSRTNVVTVSLEAINFDQPVRIGELVHVQAFATYASKRSLEIEVIVDAEDVLTGNRRYCTSSAFFIFVSLDEKHRPIEIRPLDPKTESEKRRFEEGKERYEARRSRR